MRNRHIIRIKANVIGAGVGVMCLLFSPTNTWLLTVGITITLALCYLFKPDAGIRSAIADTIITMLHKEGKHVWDTAIWKDHCGTGRLCVGFDHYVYLPFQIQNNG
ncbi:aromatic acid exporter family protein [Runella sp.]|uniref:aromatic acid exporter family protein n=1 Tax=Runella sp. TaxID=1960881 RepID=UPI003D0F28A6